LLELGYQVIAVSPDRPEKVKAATKANKMEYTILSDSTLEVAQGLGIAFKAGDETVSRLKGYDIDIEEESGEKHHLLPVPAVFLLDTDGTILFEYVNPDYRVRIQADVLLAAARSYAD
jgi:peroxiredoxin